MKAAAVPLLILTLAAVPGRGQSLSSGAPEALGSQVWTL